MERSELHADGTYVTDAHMECGGNKIPFPTSGFFGVIGGVMTFSVATGPAAAGSTKLAGDTITTVAGPDTYVYKKQ